MDVVEGALEAVVEEMAMVLAWSVEEKVETNKLLMVWT